MLQEIDLAQATDVQQCPHVTLQVGRDVGAMEGAAIELGSRVQFRQAATNCELCWW
jgi:hypothetical protein